MSYENILFEVKDGYAVLTLNQPETLNAFTVAMHEELREATDQVVNDDSIRALLITGAGRGFCAGANLAERNIAKDAPRPDMRANLDRLYNPLIKKIRSMPTPVVVAVNGVAAGAGMSLAIAGDLVLAGESAVFLQAFCKIGLVPDAGSTWHLPRLIGAAKARGMALLGEKIPAAQAEEWGLIWKCLPDDELMAEAEGLTARLAKAPTAALGLIKQALNASLTNDLSTQLDMERDLQFIAGHTDDFIEGVTAFLEKRAPDFSGK